MSQKVIILCGPDMTGKTEIAKELARVYSIPYFKASSERKTYLKEKDVFKMQTKYADPRIADFLGQTGHSVVFDRAYPCEWVYSKVFGRETDLKALEKVDASFAGMDTHIIITHRTSYEGIVDDIDPKINEEYLNKLDNEYSGFSKWTKCKTLMLNVDDEDLDKEIKNITLWLEGTSSNVRNHR